MWVWLKLENETFEQMTLAGAETVSVMSLRGDAGVLDETAADVEGQSDLGSKLASLFQHGVDGVARGYLSFAFLPARGIGGRLSLRSSGNVRSAGYPRLPFLSRAG